MVTTGLAWHGAEASARSSGGSAGPARSPTGRGTPWPDDIRYSRTLTTKMDAEAWLASEHALIDRDSWSPPRARQEAVERREREALFNTVGGFAGRYLSERSLRPNTHAGYRQLLDSRILPMFRDIPLVAVTLADIKTWRAAMDPNTEAMNAAAYRLLRTLLQAAEQEELIDRAPPKIRGASTARVKRVAKPATLDELAVIIENMPERLRLFIVLAALVGLREGEALELRRSDDGRIAQSTSPGRSTRTPTAMPRAHAATATPRSPLRRPSAASGPCTYRHPSCRCCKSTCSSTPRPDLRGCTSPSTARTT